MKKLRDYQSKSVSQIRYDLANPKYKRKIIFESPTGSGKCLGINTPILMFDGSIKMVQDIKVGDLLMGDDGTQRYVKSTCTGYEMMYKITPNKGDSFICNESHILSLRYSDIEHKFAIRNIELLDYLKLNKTNKHILKQYRIGVEFSHKQTIISPYLLGLWLAEGTKRNGSPELSININDIDILNYLINLGAYTIEEKSKNCLKVRLPKLINNINPCRSNENLYRTEFKKCLYNYHYDIGIPNDYKINSRENRLELLAGLLDGDGYHIRGGFEIITKFKRLREDILYLCRSLGLAAYWSIKKVDVSKLKLSKKNEEDIREYYRIVISGDCTCIPNKVPRKKAKVRLMNKNTTNVGFKVDKIGVDKYYGFEIDGINRLFLLGDFTVTHNTIMFSYIAQQASLKNSKVLILSSRTEILVQNGGALTGFGLKPTYISPNHKKVPENNLVCAMSQTLKRRVEKEEWREYLKTVNLCIIDETHEQISDFIHEYLSDKCYVLGVTATPARYGNMNQLGSMYNHIVSEITIKELIDLGYLSKAKHYSIAAPKFIAPYDSSIGDYNQSALAKAYEQRVHYVGIVQEYLRLTPHKKTICFCVSGKQAIEVTKEFVANGVSAKYILSDSKTQTDTVLSGKRDIVFNGFKNNDFTVLVGVGIFVAGFDCPDIEVVILNFATISLTKYKQALGRGARVTPTKKEFTVLDAGRNFEQHGLYEQEVQFNLWHHSGQGGGLGAVRECGIYKGEKKPDEHGNNGCGQLIPIPFKKCPNCGYEWITERVEYTMALEEVVQKVDDWDNATLGEWASARKLEGWSMHRICLQACLKNPTQARKVVYEICDALKVSKGYWYAFDKNIWSKHKHKIAKKLEDTNQNSIFA